jgi:phosphatidate phosphatase APP1
MTTWYERFAQLASSLDRRFDYAKFRVKLRRGWVDPLMIQPYRGHGTADVLHLRGRVLENKRISSAEEQDSVWENVLNMYKRFASDEVPGAHVQAEIGGRTFEAVADNEGYFHFTIAPPELPLERVWHHLRLTLLTPTVEDQPPVHAVGRCLVPPPKSEFGIISDIDDTIVRTGATDPLTMARIVVLNNPHTRMPFEGVAAFYQALRKGGDGAGYNPIFYVSSSPWNLYDLLVDFMNINGIPVGPIFLRDIGLENDHFIKSDHHEHKLKQIRMVLTTHRDLPFILIGDSGQEDPEIYREVVREFPGRISAIYVRDVTLEERATAVRRIIDEVGASNVEMLLVPDTTAAAEHAVARGFITADKLPAIREEKARDAQAPTVADQVIDAVTPPPIGAEEGTES